LLPCKANDLTIGELGIYNNDNKKKGSLDISQPYVPPQPAAEIALRFFTLPNVRMTG
jgi:hypothetical protein